MVKIKHSSPLSVRSVVALAPTIDRGMPEIEHRPYLVTPQPKPAQSAQRYLALFPHESEDARLTGETRSLYRRLLALNLPKAVQNAAAVPSAAIAKGIGPTFASPKIA